MKKIKSVNIIIIIFIVLIAIVLGMVILSKGNNSNNQKFETYKSLDQYNIDFDGKIEISGFSKTEEGSIQVITNTKDLHRVKIKGTYSGNYFFTITDKSGREYKFEYHYDKKSKEVLLNEVK